MQRNRQCIDPSLPGKENDFKTDACDRSVALLIFHRLTSAIFTFSYPKHHLGTLDDEIVLSRTNEFNCQNGTNRESFIQFKKCPKCEYTDDPYKYNENYYDDSSSYGYYGYYAHDEPSQATVRHIWIIRISSEMVFLVILLTYSSDPILRRKNCVIGPPAILI